MMFILGGHFRRLSDIVLWHWIYWISEEFNEDYYRIWFISNCTICTAIEIRCHYLTQIVRLGYDLCAYCLHTCILVHILIKIFQVAFHGLEFYLTGTNPMQLHFLRFRGRNGREWVSKPDPSVYFIFQSYFYTRPGSNYRILGPFLFLWSIIR